MKTCEDDAKVKELNDEYHYVEYCVNRILDYSSGKIKTSSDEEKFLAMKMFIDNLDKHYDRYFALKDEIMDVAPTEYELCKRRFDVLSQMHKVAFMTHNSDLVNYVDNKYLTDKIINAIINEDKAKTV